MPHPRLRIGRLRFLVDIEVSEETIDDHGRPVPVWTVEASRHASIEPLTSIEKVDTDRFTTEATHKIVLRYYAGLTTSHRIVYDDRTYNLKEVLDVNLQHVRHDCMAEEVQE